MPKVPTDDRLTYDLLHEFLEYRPETGEFFWRVQRGQNKPGDPAGTLYNNGYVVIRINRKGYLAHRLAWFMEFGQWPENHLDHINRDRADNRLVNLRLSRFM